MSEDFDYYIHEMLLSTKQSLWLYCRKDRE